MVQPGGMAGVEFSGMLATRHRRRQDGKSATRWSDAAIWGAPRHAEGQGIAKRNALDPDSPPERHAATFQAAGDRRRGGDELGQGQAIAKRTWPGPLGEPRRTQQLHLESLSERADAAAAILVAIPSG